MTDPRSPASNLLAAAALGATVAFGLALGGYFVADALYAVRASDRFVTVKGLSEREVPADMALWPISYTVTADDLESLQQRIEAGESAIRAFLAPRFEPDEISVSVPQITDRESFGRGADQPPLDRYHAQAAVILRSSDIDGVRDAMARSGELVKAGVALVRDYQYQTQFLFTGLEMVKPQMIAEATRDARRAAEQFAEDSGSRVGAIRKAQQGYFSIEDRDAFSPEHKRLRVVTTVEFFLLDD